LGFQHRAAAAAAAAAEKELFSNNLNEELLTNLGIHGTFHA
jgi:hypothetical protein